MRPRILLLGLLGLLLLGGAGPGRAAARELSDDELDQVTAGGVSVEVLDGVLNFQFRSAAGGGVSVDGSGTLSMSAEQLPNSVGAIVLRDSAQGNLRSVVNVTAVNSAIQVLINLNVNVNSSVGTLRQLNLSGRF